MFIHNFDPVLINLGYFELRWYSLAYIVGISIGWWLGKKILSFKIKNQNVSCSYEDFDNLIFYVVLSLVIGGRIGYVLFYNFDYYLNYPTEILKIWQGGMSFHGGLIGVILATYLFAKNKNLETFIFLDIIACVAPIGLFLGRIANFINGELYGKPTNQPWSVIFPDIDNIPRHPSQLYEAFLEGIILFVILILVTFNKKIINGYSSIFFLILYGLFRITCERFREPDIQVGYLFDMFSMGSILSLIMIIAGVLIFVKVKSNER